MNSPEISIDIIIPRHCKFNFARKRQASHASEERHGSRETGEIKIHFSSFNIFSSAIVVVDVEEKIIKVVYEINCYHWETLVNF